MKPFCKSVEVAERLEGQVELLILRFAAANYIRDPSGEVWIVAQRDLHVHAWCRQPGLLENPVQGETHLRVHL